MVEQLSTYATYDPATQQWKPKDPTAYRVMTEGTKVTVESVPETYTTYRDMKKANTPHEDWHKGNFIRTTYVFVDGSLREELVRDSYALDKGGNLYKEGVYTKYERSYQDGQVRETENVLVSHQTKGGRTKNKVQSRQRYYEKIDQATAQKEAERKAKKLAEQDPLYEVTYKGRTYSTKSRDFVPLAAKQDRARYEQELLAIPKGTRLAPEKVRIGTIELSPRFMDKVNQSFEEQYPIPTRKRAAIDAGYTSFLGDLALSDKAAPQFRTALGLLAIEQQVSEIRMGAFARPQVAQQDQSFIPPGAKKAFSVWADTSSKASFLYPWPSIAARKKTYNLLVEKGKPVIGFAVEKLTQYDAFVEKEFDITQKVQAGDKSYYANPLYAVAQKNDRARNVLLGVSAGGKLLLKYPPLFAAGEIRFGFEVGATRGKVITDTAAEIKKSLNTAGGRQQLGGMVLTLAAPWGVSTLGRARTAKASTGADQALQKGKGLTTRERVIESPIEGFGTPQLRLSDIGSLLSTSQRKAVRKALMRATEEIMIEVSPGPKGQLKGRRLPVEPQYKALRYLEGPRAKPRKTTEAVVTEARWRAAVEERALGRPAAHKVKAIKQRVKGGELPEAKLLTATTKRKGRSTLLEFSIPKGSGIDRLYNALVRPKRRRGRITGGPERFDILPFLDKGPLRPKPRKSIHAVISEVRWQEAVAERATLRAEKAKVKAIKQRVRGGETVGGDLFIQATKRKGRSKLVEINARTDGIFDKVFDSIRRPKRRRGRITGGPERYDLLKVLPRNEDLILVFDKQKPAKAIFKDFFPEEGTTRKKGSPGPPPKKKKPVESDQLEVDAGEQLVVLEQPSLLLTNTKKTTTRKTDTIELAPPNLITKSVAPKQRPKKRLPVFSLQSEEQLLQELEARQSVQIPEIEQIVAPRQKQKSKSAFDQIADAAQLQDKLLGLDQISGQRQRQRQEQLQRQDLFQDQLLDQVQGQLQLQELDVSLSPPRRRQRIDPTEIIFPKPKKRKGRKKKKKKTQYTPSLTASLFELKGRADVLLDIRSGIGVQPIDLRRRR